MHFTLQNVSKKFLKKKVLKKKVQKKKQTNRPVFAVTFDQRLPAIDTISAKDWRAMTSQDQYSKEVFPQPPLTAHKTQPNLGHLLVRAKVADN